MKTIYFILLLSLNSLNTLAQVDSAKSYPFDVSKKIEIVIFSDSFEQKQIMSDISCVKIPKLNGKIDVAKFYKRKTLDNSEIEKLIYVVNFRAKDCSENIYEREKCNEAGYGVIFYNSKNEVFEYLELCFNCQEFQVS